MGRQQLEAAVQAHDADPASATREYGPIADWDVSLIFDMSWLFDRLQNFNADISNWHTSGVTTMESMFYKAEAFNQPLSFDSSRVTDMRSMLREAKAFNQPLSFDTSRVTTMEEMFEK